MLNYLWVFMILAGVVYGICTGRIEAVSDAFLAGGGEAVSLCITMLGIITLWTGVMNIAMKSGLIDAFQRKITPVISWLFPQVPKEHPARKYIALNFVANICGLGWAATPAGLKAMEELSALQDEEAGCHVESLSDAMCTFLVINISSIQLIPITIIAYRAEYGSKSPAAIIVPALLATFISTVVSVIFCKIKTRNNFKRT